MLPPLPQPPRPVPSFLFLLLPSPSSPPLSLHPNSLPRPQFPSLSGRSHHQEPPYTRIAWAPIRAASSCSPTTIFRPSTHQPLPSPRSPPAVLLTAQPSPSFLFALLRRQARRAKELRVRSTGVQKTKDIKEEALESLKAMGAASVEAGRPPSPVQAFLGGIAAGAIALILYKFTTTIEAALNRQTISDNFSVRQITITIRTIINGLCYLATFVFGINSVGLLLYSIQLAFSSFMESPADNMSSMIDEGQTNLTNDDSKSSTDNADSRSSSMQAESSDDS
ncbi:LOW QUALITY PROTEIN: uncharacterized protein LOC109846188 [Asparagus officinalis]|uniref:LOW QUALITY PROTEIN: uncharacterized protein LOC109846188 n=1 Tax=Asparagus officinalis TaxID=4686 RepID=UPI00098E1A8B|nr:LOW QUALITY PROTEIN: uncharacterized protein LOC109846188 [Asparagus officinalis]